MSYKSGIYSAYCKGRMDHAVVVVGYDSSALKIRNSWGTSWGEKGYFRFARGKDECNVADDVSYPVL